MKYILCLLLLPSFSFAKQTKDGRFQIIQPGTIQSDQYLLDTHTGQIWRIIEGPEGKLFWKKELIEGINATWVPKKSD